MRRDSQTTLIERLVNGEIGRTAELDPVEALALMRRALPPTRTLLAVSHQGVQARLGDALWADLLDLEVVPDRREAMELLTARFYPIVLTDSLDLIRAVRPRKSRCTSVVIYLSPRDSATERSAGIRAGADECVGLGTSEEELHARIVAARRVAELESVLRTALDENHRLSSIDELTRIGSKRFFGTQFAREAGRAARERHALSLVLCDIDHFKSINDTLGHAGGDEVLRHFGARLQRFVGRDCNWIARIGGEEFAIVLPGMAVEAAAEVARRLLHGVSSEAFQVEGTSLHVTASFGVSGVERVPADLEAFTEQVFRSADAALYRSKKAGRNRVTIGTLAEVNVQASCG